MLWRTRARSRRHGGDGLRARLLAAAATGAVVGVATAISLTVELGTNAAASPPGRPAVDRAALSSPVPDPRPVVAYGDSLTFGWGVPAPLSYTAVLQRLMGQSLVTRGLPGKPSATGLSELPGVLSLDPQAVVLEFGSVDACIGVPMETAEQNLDRILTILDAHHVGAVIVGTHVGTDRSPNPAICPHLVAYESIWDAALQSLAQRHHSALVLDVLHGLGAQPDGYHPDAAGNAIMAERVAVPLRALEATSRLPV
jgi:acyl-CoA thioesterase-1